MYKSMSISSILYAGDFFGMPVKESTCVVLIDFELRTELIGQVHAGKLHGNLTAGGSKHFKCCYSCHVMYVMDSTNESPFTLFF